MDRRRKLELIRRRGAETMAKLLQGNSEALSHLLRDIKRVGVLKRLNGRYVQENRYELTDL